MSDVYLWETYDRLGREAIERRDLSQAAEAFRSAIAVAEDLGSNDRLALSLRNLSAVMVDQGALNDSHDLLSRTLELCMESLGAQHSQTVETQRDLARVCRDLGFLDKAEGLLKIVLSEDSKTGSQEQITGTLDALARLSLDKQDFAAAATYFEQIVELKTRALGDESPEVAQYLLKLSTALYQCGESDKAQSSLNVALGILEKQYAGEPLHLAQSLLASAQLMVEASQLDPALIHQKRALDILADNLPPDHEKLWETRELIATTLAAKGMAEEAVELLEYCLRNRKDTPDHQMGALHKNLAGLYLTLGKNERAEELYTQAAEFLERSLGPDHPAVLATREERIQLYHFTGRPQEALDLALTTIRATENRFGPGHPNTAQVYASTALLAFNAQNWDTALELMRGAEKIWQSLRPKPEDVLANCRTNIATCLFHLEKFEEAERILEQAEETAGASLRPVLSNLRAQIQSRSKPQEPEVQAVKEDKPIEAKPAIDDDFDLPDLDEFLADVSEETGSPAADLPDIEELDLPDIVAEEIPGLEDSTEETVATESLETENQDAPVIQAVAAEAQEPEATEAVSAEESLEEEPVSEAVAAEAQEPEATEAVSAEESLEEEPVSEAVAAEAQEPEATEAVSAEESLEEEPEGEAEAENPESPAVKPAFAEDAETEQLTEELDPTAAPVSPKEQLDPHSEGFVERRKRPRQPLSLNKFFNLIINQSGGTVELKSFLVDLGMGGIRINTETPFPKEGPLTVTLPSELLGQEAEFTAEVVWQKPLYGSSYLQGLAFTELSETQEEMLKKRLDADENTSGRANSRQHFRLYRPFPIKLQAEGGDSWVSSYATDLSINGLGTRLGEALNRDDGVRVRLELEFELPTVEVQARVAWSREGENGVTHGLQFDAVGPVEAKTIKRYIDRCLAFLPD